MNVVRFGGKSSNQNRKALSVVVKLALREGVRGAGIEPARDYSHRILSITYSISNLFREVLKTYILFGVAEI